ncbi:MAG TPA: DUF2341 domain-containing protein, partial [bacterium]|nr:DUF2341 domain-containing protein [bacterium]
LSFNHAALVTSGHSMATGGDVRVVREMPDTTNMEVDRVLDPATSWNSTTTTIWFRISTPPVVGEQWWLYYGNPSAGAPPANPNNVFLFSEDFESGTLGKWNADAAGVFNISTAKAHGGTYAVAVTNQGNKNHWITEQTGTGTDLRMDAWWYTTDPGNDDIAQGFRSGPVGTFRDYETNLHGGGGLDIAEYIAAGSHFNEFQGTGGSTPANTWFHVAMTLVGTQMNVYINPTAAALSGQTATRSHAVNGDYASGGASLRSFAVKNNQFWYVDDIVLRPYQNSEPVLTLGSAQTF